MGRDEGVLGIWTLGMGIGRLQVGWGSHVGYRVLWSVVVRGALSPVELQMWLIHTVTQLHHLF